MIITKINNIPCYQSLHLYPAKQHGLPLETVIMREPVVSDSWSQNLFLKKLESHHCLSPTSERPDYIPDVYIELTKIDALRTA